MNRVNHVAPTGARRVSWYLTAAFMITACLGASACTNQNDIFCDKLDQGYRLTSLAEAIRSRDVPGIEKGLTELRELQWETPEEISDDMVEVVDLTDEIVRAVTSAGEPGSNSGPVDLTTLNDKLARIEPATQRIEAFADRNCAVALDE